MQVHARTLTVRTAMLVSADASLRQRLSETLIGMRWHVREASGGAEALTCLEETPCEALLLDSWLPDLEAKELAAHLRDLYPALDLIRMDESAPPTGAARSSRRNELLYALHRAQEEPQKGKGMDAVWEPSGGSSQADSARSRLSSVEARGLRSPRAHGLHPAGSFLTTKNSTAEPVRISEVLLASPIAIPAVADPIQPAARSEARPISWGIPEMIGRSRVMETLAQHIRLVAPRKTTVLIDGPTGSGKELVARALHRLSARADRPFVVLNCAAIPDALLEAELFGHTRGAFTGAVQSRVGHIEAAHGGTLFLDEIGEMPLALQAKLLRFLEAGEVQRIGENEPIKVDVRVIAATHQQLAKHSEEGRFRSDLFYRLSVFTLHTAPLGEHAEDIPVLAGHFLDRLTQREPAKSFTEEAIAQLCTHSWPGNVRELAHVVERAYILAEGRPQITADEIFFA